MIHFLRNLFVFLVITLLSVVIFIFLVHATVAYISDFELPHDTELVIIGHSHPECAFDDSKLRGAVNLSSSGEAYFYSYLKLKNILAANELQNVFIEFTNNSLAGKMNEWTWGLEKMSAFVPLYYPFMSWRERFYLGDMNPQDFILALSTSTRNNLTRILSGDFALVPRFGSFKPLVESKVEDFRNIPPLELRELFDHSGYSALNLAFLDSIVLLCREQEINLYFVRSPQHHALPRDNEDLLLSIKDIRYPNIPFLDFDRFPLGDSAYADLAHLNAVGAGEFSGWLHQALESGLLTKEDPAAWLKDELFTRDNSASQ